MTQRGYNMKTNKKSLETIKTQLKEWGYSILDDSEYKNTHTALNLIDEENYKYFISYDYVRYNIKHNGTPIRFGKANPHTIENLQLYIDKTNCGTKILDTEYHNQKHKMNLICGKCHNKYQDTANHILTKTYIYCKKCGIKRSAETHRYSVEDVKKRLMKFGYKLLNENFQAIHSLEVEDAEGYRSSCANLYNIEQGQPILRNSKLNLYTPYNIDLYLQKQGILTRVADLTPRRIEMRRDKIGFICNQCGNVFYAYFDKIKQSGRILCQDCSTTMSNLEYKVKEYLDEKNVHYEMQKRFPKCKKKRCLPFDFYLTDFNYAIEVNGGQHYYDKPFFTHKVTSKTRTFEQQKEYDEYKKQFCVDNNIGYLELPFWLINNPPQTFKKKIDEIIEDKTLIQEDEI